MADTTAKIKLALEGAGVVEQGLASVQSQVQGLGKTLAGLAGGLTVAGFAAFIKGSINAADEMSKLSQKTGVLVKDVAGLQLAFRQAGAGEQFVQSMARLSKEAAGGGKALAELGVAVRGSDGAFKTSRQLLGEVADKFAGMKDGIEKTAAAQAVFGKSGADLIPLLNAGGSALDEYDRLAQQLGLTMDEGTTKAAEKFNDTIDLMGQGVTGIGRQIAAQLLPTLTGLAGQFLDNMTKGDRLKKTADFLAAGLKGLYVVALGVVEVFSTVGKTLGGVSAAIVAALRGDFAGAANILRDMKTDIGSGWKDTLAQMQGAWSATGSAAVEAMAAASGAATRAGAAVKGAAGRAREVVDEFARLRDKLTAKETGTNPDFIKNLKTLKEGLDARRISMQEYLRLADLEIALQPYMIAQTKAQAEATAAAAKAEQDLIAGYDKSAASAEKRLQDMQLEASAIAYAQANQVSLAQAVEYTTIARLEEQKVANAGNKAILNALDAEIEARRQIIGMLGSQQAREAAEKARTDEVAAWQKANDQIAQSLTDALMQGGKSVKQYLIDLFRTTVLRPILAPIGAGMASLFGGPAAAGQGGGGFGLGDLSSIKSLYDTLNTGISSAITKGFEKFATSGLGERMGLSFNGGNGSQLTGFGDQLGSGLRMAGDGLAALGIQKALSGGYKTGASGLVDVATAIGGAIFGPVAGVVGGLFNRAFGRKLKDAGFQGSFGGAAGFTGQNFEFHKGGWFRSDKTKTSAMDPAMQQAFADSYKAITVQTGAMAQILGLNADVLAGFSSSIKLSTKGLSEEQIQQKIGEAFGKISDEQAQLLLGEFKTVQTRAGGGFGAAILRSVRGATTTEWIAGPFVRAGETAGEALRRLSSSLSTVNAVFDTLNQSLFATSVAGADVASKLLDAFGGAEAFVAQTSAYYEAFYSEAERTDIATRQLTTTLAGMGLALPGTREAFRTLVEAQDLYTDAGRATYAALIGLAPVFDQISQAADAAAQEAAKAADQLRTAMERLGASLSDEVRRLRGLLTSSSPASAAALQAQFATATAQARAGDAGALERLPQISQALESAAALQAVTAADIALMRGQLAASLSQTLQMLGLDVPQFAVGTNYVPSDMLAQIHKGEAIVPKAYNPAAGGAGSNADLVPELRAMRAELEGLRAEVRADVLHNAKTARILERVTPDGTALNTTVAA